MKTFLIILLLAGLTTSPSVSYADNEPEVNKTADLQNTLYESVTTYLNAYRESKAKVAFEQEMLSKMAVIRAQIAQNLQNKKTALKSLKHDNRSLSRNLRKDENHVKSLNEDIEKYEKEVATLQTQLDRLDLQIEGQQLNVQTAKDLVISDRKFDRQLNTYRDDAKSLQKSNQDHAQFTGGKSAPLKPELAALVNQSNSQLRSTYSKAEVKKEEPKEIVIADPAPADCKSAFESLGKMKQEYADQIEKMQPADSCDAVEKDLRAKTVGFADKCGKLTLSNQPDFKNLYASFNGDEEGAGTSFANDKPVSELMNESINGLSQMVKAKCDSSQAAKKQSADANQKVCQDNALRAMAMGTGEVGDNGVLKKNPKLISDLYDLSVRKMVYALKASASGKTSIEDAMKDLTKQGRDLGEVKKSLAGLYQSFGKKDDLEKIRIFKSDSQYGYRTGKLNIRLDNDNASAVVMMLAKQNPSATDLTESDAATIWAVEKIRASQDQKKFGLGTLEGNQLNFSTRVYSQLAKNDSTLAADSTIADYALNALVQNAFNHLSLDMKKCMTGGTCEQNAVLNADQLKKVQQDLLRLVQRDLASEENIMIDPAHSVVSDGKIILSIKK